MPGASSTARDFVPTNALWNVAYGRWFFLTPSAMTWDPAQAYARQIGGNLATVTDGTLNTWIQNEFKSAGNYWIGLNSCSGQWASGAPSTYRNWHSGEPTGDGCATEVYTDGTWNDLPSNLYYRGVVEVTGEPPGAVWNNDYARLFFPTPTAMTWSDAQAYAKLMGGNLATITDGMLNTWLRDQFKSLGIYWIELAQSSYGLRGYGRVARLSPIAIGSRASRVGTVVNWVFTLGHLE